MNCAKIISSTAAAAVLLCATGCFRVSSETRALRDVGLEFGTIGAEEKIELGLGFFTVGLARLGTRFVDLPPEARAILGSVNGAECSVYRLQGRKADVSQVLIEADKAMAKRGCERIVGVIDKEQLVAVYVPRNISSKKTSLSVLVLTGREMVCATARGDMEAVMQMAFTKAQEQLPKKADLAATF